MLSPDTLEIGRRFAAAYRGLDELYRSKIPNDVWGIVVLDMGDPSDRQSFANSQAAASTFAELGSHAERLPEPDRRAYYRDLARSAETLLAWLDDESAVGIEGQISGYLGAEPRPVSDTELKHLETAIHDALLAEGFTGPLRLAARAWEQAHQVDPGELKGKAEELIDETAERTRRRVIDDLPPQPSVDIVSGVAYNARCNHAENVVEINRDPVVTAPYLKRLILHEVYPGHSLQFASRARAHEEGWGTADGLLSTVKCAASPIFEGLADAGAWLLGWIEPSDVTASLIYRYQTGLCTVASHGLHAQGWSRDQAREYLASRALVGGDGWIEHRLGYIGARGRGAHIWSYWLGESYLRSSLHSVGPELDANQIRILYGRLHSLESLRTTDWRSHD